MNRPFQSVPPETEAVQPGVAVPEETPVEAETAAPEPEEPEAPVKEPEKDAEASGPAPPEPPLEYHPRRPGVLTPGREPAGGPCQVGSLTGAVAS